MQRKRDQQAEEKRSSITIRRYHVHTWEAFLEEAKKAGDTRVWFLDGREFFGELGRTECTVDGTHPNVLGFMRMAEKIYPVIRDILYDAGGNG